MRYRLRTLLIVLALGPALLAWAWLASVDLRKEWRQCFLVEAQLRTVDGDVKSIGDLRRRKTGLPLRP